MISKSTVKIGYCDYFGPRQSQNPMFTVLLLITAFDNHCNLISQKTVTVEEGAFTITSTVGGSGGSGDVSVRESEVKFSI